MKGIIARKIGMSRVICSETGHMTPVTLLETSETKILQIKTREKDGYDAAVIAGFPRNRIKKNINKNFKCIKELGLSADQSYKKDDIFNVSELEGIETVKVTGTSKGRGFSGVIKRHNFRRGPETHGSHHHREPGSVGTCAKPARMLKGKKLPGQYGNSRKTIDRVRVIQIDSQKNLIALKGAVPGAKNSFVFIREG